MSSKGEAANTLAKGAVSFLSKICGPFAEEYGLYLQDQIKNRRANNLTKMSQKGERKLEESGGIDGKFAHPRMISQIFEHGSWIDEDNVQEMWAGLLASSCTKSGKDDSNLIFINILSQLTVSEAKILNFACEKVKKKTNKVGLIYANHLVVNLEELREISGIANIHQLDRELDHLRSMDLIFKGFDLMSSNTFADIGPTSLALHMYVRCQGSLQSPVDYFELGT